MAKKILQSYDFAGNQLIDARVENLASFPTAGKAGRFVLNTTTALVGFDDGTAFRVLAPLDSPAFTGAPSAPTPAGGDNSTKIATTAWVLNEVSGLGSGDMLKAVYDSNDDGKVDAADVADAAPWAGITGKPSTFTPSAHTHPMSEVTDAGALATLDTVDTAQVDDEAITLAKMAHIATSRLLGRVSASTGDVETLTAAQVKTFLALAIADVSGLQTALDGKAASSHSHIIADVSGLQTALDGKAASSHNHTASQITDFDAEVEAKIISYWDTIANTDADIDTIRELMDLVLSNESGLTNLIGRHNEDIGDGASTSIAVTHNLGSLDVSVEVYEISSGETVSVGVTRTNTNVVTLSINPAPATDSLRVVIKK